ncbi:FAD-binding domain-containing protein [Jannaschia formosa]|uniref:FAD-binding domain-containing protein n=1 Tax=Jannaschia formosa TaxID=2259592 RepID=UPI000E1B9F80|nr:FAD-binding domain-containing protein [Jannaschia formosa]TFL18540.1 DNA photolyase [Jannaschia formosa]
MSTPSLETLVQPDPDPTRAAGLERLAQFVPRAGRDYAEGRNHDLAGHPHVSGLSPWLRHRTVTEAEVAGAVLDRFAPSTAEKFLQEVLWRGYFKGWLERRPSVWEDYRRGLDAARNRLATESGLRRAWEEACEGRTGIAPFDDWAGELARTGYLHNHARMWFASIWMHTLRLPWELGADFFLRHLLDGDPASNTLSWRWVAGLHTRGKVYRARASNIAKFTGGRWDARRLGHQLATEDEVTVPEAPPPAPSDMPEDAAWQRGLRTGLLLHEDDLHPDYLFARGLTPDAAAVLISPAGRSPLAVSPKVAAFVRGLAEDAAARVSASLVTDRPEEIVAWAREAGLRQVVAPYAPVGPGRAALDRVAAALDIPVIRPLRAWDQAVWPHATAGYFKVKARLERVLEAIPEDRS